MIELGGYIHEATQTTVDVILTPIGCIQEPLVGGEG